MPVAPENVSEEQSEASQQNHGKEHGYNKVHARANFHLLNVIVVY